MKIIYLLIIFCLAEFALGQEIPRHGLFGVYAVQLSDSSKQILQLDNDALEVKWLRPEGTESKVGLKTGDILYQINDIPIHTPNDIYYSGLLNRLRSGEDICYHILRSSKKMKLCGKVKPNPLETILNGEVIYDEVEFKNGQLRTIITKPKREGKSPVIYFIPGYNCASYDNLPSFHPYRKIIDSLTNLGYVVFRTEKSGMGDSYNTPNCFEIDFYTEQEGFEVGYKKLLTYDFIDTSEIFIFGHSLGGINAPLIAEKFNPKGVIVYGTTHLPWMEYLTNMLRFQNPLLGISPIEIEKDAKTYQSLLYDHYVLKQSPEEMVLSHPEYLPLLERDFQYIGGDMIFQRHYSFMQQLNDLPLTSSWSNLNSHVLSIYGEADFEAINPDSHKEIVRIVNYYHPDRATFLLLPETNHSFIKVGSMQAGIDASSNGVMRELMKTSFNYDIVTEIDKWIKSLK